jgi:hypothetical protein
MNYFNIYILINSIIAIGFYLYYRNFNMSRIEQLCEEEDVPLEPLPFLHLLYAIVVFVGIPVLLYTIADHLINGEYDE